MSEINDQIIENHEYDGIREYDNPLPMWWLWTFFITIIFGFLYWVHYSFTGAPTQWDNLKADLAEIKTLQKGAPAGGESDADFAALMSSNGLKSQGEGLYMAKCSACHGPALQGQIGPNLTDDYWIHGKGTPADIAKVVREGVLDKGMPNWGEQLSSDELKAVVVFVATKQGSQPANPKAPQGEKVVR